MCTNLVCVLFVATPTSTIHVYYFSICTLLKYVYCLWPLPHLLFMCTTLVLFMCTTLIHVSYNSVSVYYFYYYMLKLYLPPPGGEESCWTTASHWRPEFSHFFHNTPYNTSLCLLLWLALRVLFVATPTSSTSVYYCSMCTDCGMEHTCTICGHPTMSNYLLYHSYKIVAVLAFQLSLLLFKQLQIGSTCVLFVATTIHLFEVHILK